MAGFKKARIGSLQISPETQRQLVDMACFTAEDFAPAGADEKEDFIPRQKSVSYWQDAWRRLKKNRVSMVAMGILIVLVLFAFLGPMLLPYKYQDQLRHSLNTAPLQYSEDELAMKANGEAVFPHFFGTDTLGRDILARVMIGTRVSMGIGVLAALLVLVIGSVYGAVSGYLGGTVDTVMMRISEIIYTVPDVLVVLLLSITIKQPITDFINAHAQSAFARPLQTLGASVVAIFISFALLYWVGMARIIRGQVMQLKQQEYVTAARALGASGGRIIRRHLLPNCIGSLIAATCLQIPSAIFLESFLSFLGVGVSAPLTSLGSMCSDALGGMYSYTHRLIIPAVVLGVMLLCFNLFGDGLRDALDPRLKK